MREILEQILVAGNSAPSGENCQPWRFIVTGSSIELRLIRERDQSAYGWGDRASYLACGAALENIVLAASTCKYRAEVKELPDPTDPYVVARMKLTHDKQIVPDPLAGGIPSRVTNRKVYQKEPLAEADLSALRNAVTGESRLVFITEPNTIMRLARIGALNEEIMLGNDALHQFFFAHVNWTKEEDERKKVGFYIETLELPPPARLMFKLLRHRTVMHLSRLTGMPSLVARANAATYAASGGIGIVLSQGDAPLDFIRAGREVERIWLAATLQGLSLEPLTGVLFFALALLHGDTRGFSQTEAQRIQAASDELRKIAHATTEAVTFMFRIGRSAPPTARSSRFALSEAVEWH